MFLYSVVIIRPWQTQLLWKSFAYKSWNVQKSQCGKATSCMDRKTLITSEHTLAHTLLFIINILACLATIIIPYPSYSACLLPTNLLFEVGSLLVQLVGDITKIGKQLFIIIKEALQNAFQKYWKQSNNSRKELL